MNHMVPEEKCRKYLKKLLLMLDLMVRGSCILYKDMMSLNGTLLHITFVVMHRHAYLANFPRFIAQFPNKHASHHPPPSAMSDLKWWFNMLLSQPPPRCLSSQGMTQDLDLWVDASTDWGIGLVFGDRWDTWRVKEGWKGEEWNIGWLEAIAVELAVHTLFDMGWHNASVIIRSDNQGVIGAFQKGQSCNFQVNLSIHCVKAIVMESNVFHTLQYIESAQNRADATSRGEVGSPSSHLPALQVLEELTSCISTNVPFPLSVL